MEKESRIVLPGEVIIEGLNYLAGVGTYRDDKEIKSKVVGLAKQNGSIVFVIPLNGIYIPKKGDYVIAEISYISYSSWKADIGSPYDGVLPISEIDEFVEKSADLSKYFKIGELVFARVNSVTEGKIIQLSMKDRKARKLFGGKVINITPTKVPRLIGKEGTMINLIKEKTGCVIIVGQNGRVWLKGENEDLATKVIDVVDRFSHINGLTNKVTEFLNEEVKKYGKKT